MRKTIGTVAAAAAALVLTATGANAAVSVDHTTGFGFVGKGDVQTPLGLNNSQMQKAANQINFSYVGTASYAQDCQKFFTKAEWVVVSSSPVYNKQGTVVRYDEVRERVEVTTSIDKTFTKTADVSKSVQSDPRKTGQYTGWNLRGLINESGTTDAPADLCTPGIGEGEDANGWVPAVVDGVESEVVKTGDTSVLTATYTVTGQTVDLPNTPVS